MNNLYYTPPSDEAFEDMKSAAMQVWGQYFDSDHYMKEKTARIKDITNIQDNFMYMLAMFDILNQRKCIDLLKQETKDAIKERMIAGGNEETYIKMLGL